MSELLQNQVDEVVARTPCIFTIGARRFRYKALSAAQVLELDVLLRAESLKPVLRLSADSGLDRAVLSELRSEALKNAAGINHATPEGRTVLFSLAGLSHALRLAVFQEIDEGFNVLRQGPPSFEECAAFILDDNEMQQAVVDAIIRPLFAAPEKPSGSTESKEPEGN